LSYCCTNNAKCSRYSYNSRTTFQLTESVARFSRRQLRILLDLTTSCIVLDMEQGMDVT